MKIIYLLSGAPKQGKTTIANEFETKVISVDELFLQYYNYLTGVENRGRISIYELWKGFDEVRIKEFYNRICFEIVKFYISEEKEILFDGWLLTFCKDFIKNLYSKNINFCDITVFDYNCYLGNQLFYNKDIHKIKENIVYPLKKSFKIELSKQLNINYHYFDEFKFGNPKQRSKEKYSLFNFPDLTGKTVLDIGCNSGYNSIMMAETAKEVTGIDINSSAIDNANIVNRFLYERKNVKFINADVFDFTGKYDVILASSLFHYFVGRQQDFINKCYELLNNNGILILECGILINNIAPIRKDCEYTTRENLINICKEFKLIYECNSVNQIGDNVPRFVFHFKK